MTREVYAIKNTLKTFIFMGALTALLIVMGYVIGGIGWAMFMLLFGFILNFFSYWYSDSIVLAMHHAQELDPYDIPWLWERVERLTKRAEIPMPRLYLIPDDSPNAFATGRDPQNAAVAVTEGLLELMSPDEVEGVIGHELAHIKNRDILISTIASTIAGAISGLANILGFMFLFGGDDDAPNPFAALILMIVAPIAATLIQLAISRSREYEADRVGSEIVGSPIPLARALKKLGAYHERIVSNVEPAMSNMYIVSPLSSKTFATLFSTHPPLEERIQRLLELSEEKGVWA